MQSPSQRRPVHADGLRAPRIERFFLFVVLILLGLSAYLILLVPHQAVVPSSPLWVAHAGFGISLVQFVAALAALVVLLAFPSRGVTTTGFHPAYFALTACGICASLTLVILGLHQEPIETSASLLQMISWLMTSSLALIAAGRQKSLQARQWLARSVSIAATYIVLPLLRFLPGYPRLHADSAGLERAILVFAALLTADITLNWREITTARS